MDTSQGSILLLAQSLTKENKIDYREQEQSNMYSVIISDLQYLKHIEAHDN